MKKHHLIFICFALSLFYNCEPTDIEPNYSDYKPVLINRNNANAMVKFGPTKTLEITGKFYLYKDYIFLAERDQGYHVYDNKNPNNPIKIGFLHIFNSTDLAIRNNIIYANQSVDMLVIDISNPLELKLLKRIPNVSEEITPDALPLAPSFTKNRPSNTIINRYELIQSNNN